jgi:hypothetical protein
MTVYIFEARLKYDLCVQLFYLPFLYYKKISTTNAAKKFFLTIVFFATWQFVLLECVFLRSNSITICVLDY